MRCPKCQAESPVGSKYCKSCGNPLARVQAEPNVRVPEPRVSALYRFWFLGLGVGRGWLDGIERRLDRAETVLLTTMARTEFESQSILPAGRLRRRPVKYRGILVITDKRVLLFAKRPLHGFVMQDYPHEAITMVEEMRGWTTSGMRLHAASAVRDLDMMPKEDVERAASLVREQINKVRLARRESAPVPASQGSGSAPLDTLKLRLARGEISAEEFEKLRRILS